MDTLKTISDLIDTYESDGGKMGLPTLLDLQDSLAVQSYRLAEVTAEAKSQYNGEFFTRKITINRQVQALINAKISKAAASVQAESSKVGEELFESEQKAEANAYKLDLLLGQVNKVLSAIAQRVSYLKNEKHQTQA